MERRVTKLRRFTTSPLLVERLEFLGVGTQDRGRRRVTCSNAALQSILEMACHIVSRAFLTMVHEFRIAPDSLSLRLHDVCVVKPHKMNVLTKHHHLVRELTKSNVYLRIFL